MRRCAVLKQSISVRKLVETVSKVCAALKRPEKKTILFFASASLIIVSAITLYLVHQTPTQETAVNTLCTYSSVAIYDYLATVEPNLVYNNKTTVGPNDGTLFAKVTKQIDMTLTYSLHSSPEAKANISYSFQQTLNLSSPYSLITTSPTHTNQTQIQIELPSINTAELEALKKQIETETGASSSAYALEIKPTFTIEAITSAGSFQQAFTPTILVEFKYVDEGDVITIQNLKQTKSGTITESTTTTHTDVLFQRYGAYALTSISVAGLCLSTYTHRKTRPKRKKTQAEKLLAEYKDLIVETQELPSTHQDVTIVKVEDFKELAKTAEILARPVIHAMEGMQHIFCIIENNTRYQYTTNTSP